MVYLFPCTETFSLHCNTKSLVDKLCAKFLRGYYDSNCLSLITKVILFKHASQRKQAFVGSFSLNEKAVQ